ncbi:SidA/IucD/PvdA family monooxygenase [Gordonia sp. (in: high G+C Gram-positive bacteria)]|uniref:lysine N(6)-hydroxylase/L-ornithine N(5)-oxygenase family protein n=1 Tax=Gordonia sp. (in: high G+C Gram-positive bacteria) TaxID=84139 RepID=UPI00261C8B00|nr:SidA/IucD/PvdA family monooxygenase [Gordonia sp. (in: high G+C Gram-positive bacteria)]
MRSESIRVYDLIGVGFGPSNLALAIALEEHNAAFGTGLTARFFERRASFAWHPGMLLPGATMQVSFFKDLATQRDTRSGYTFLAYLADRGRLADFINLQSFFPLRAEFCDYLRWAAARVSVPVDYGCEITSVDWDGDAFVVRGRGGVYRARNLVLGSGIRAKLPAGVTPSRHVFHNHDLLDRLAELPEPAHGRYAVIGSGQSGAEVAEYLLSTTGAQVHAVFGKYGYTPADDSPYANRVFDASTVDEFFGADAGSRERLLHDHRGTNYSAVDGELIEQLYRREYAERVSGARRFFVHGASETADLAETGDGARLRVRSRLTGEVTVLDCDAVILATGFEPVPVERLLGGLASSCRTDAAGRPVLDRRYRLSTDPHITGSIFVQGNSEHSHGLTSSLLSNVAVRAGEIVDTLAETVDHSHLAAPRAG